jgi:hypothetical protein
LRALTFITLFCGCAAPPAPDACLGAAQQRAEIDQVEIGAGDDAEFQPLAENAEVRVVRGPQGGDMIPLRIRVSGASPPACLQQSTSVEQPATQVSGMLATPLATYPDAPGTRATRTLYVVLNGVPKSGETARIAVDCAGKRTERTVRVIQ